MFGEWRKQRKLMRDASSYVRATDAVSRPVAVLMTVVGFLIILVLLAALFLAGRWTYRQLTKDNTAQQTTQTTSGTNPELPGITAVPDATGNTTTNPTPTTTPNTGPAPEIIPDTGPGTDAE